LVFKIYHKIWHAGLLSIAYAKDVNGYGSQRPETLKSGTSFMGLLSGGFGLKKFFDDPERDKNVSTPLTGPPVASEGSCHGEAAGSPEVSPSTSGRMGKQTPPPHRGLPNARMS